jgi:exoribonuclease-2
VQISVRQRGAPLDLIVAEAAIVANSTWGQLAGRAGRARHLPQPGQHGPGREGAHGHQGAAARGHWRQKPIRLGHIAAAPLHRSGQPVADHCLRPPRQATAALAAPFKPKDADLFSIISSFDAAYSAYNGYQAGMERFWTLKYIEQNHITELTAAVIKEGPGGSFLVRADATFRWSSPCWARKTCRAARA